MSVKPIFNEAELEENQLRKNDLFQLVQSGQAILFVGAGSSVRLGYPGWNDLLEQLENLAEQTDAAMRNDDPLCYADKLKSLIVSKYNEGRYLALIQNCFKTQNTSQFNQFHRTLVSLPFKGIVTTNYDHVLEAALGAINSEHAYDNGFSVNEDSANFVSDFLLSLNHREFTRRIAHLHGSINYPKNIILTAQDYKNAYRFSISMKTGNIEVEQRWSIHRKLLWSVLATHRVVFVGFSMRDPYLAYMLSMVSEDLWRWEQPIHFGIMDISNDNAVSAKDEARVWGDKYGMSVVFYENHDGTHAALDQIMEELQQFCQAGSISTSWIDNVNEKMKRLQTDAD